jgi:hypothetical protein
LHADLRNDGDPAGRTIKLNHEKPLQKGRVSSPSISLNAHKNSWTGKMHARCTAYSVGGYRIAD